MLFKELQLIEPILRALSKEGYEQPTPVQEQAIPIVLEGKDLLGCAQTGTGKTAAFAIPIIQLLAQELRQERLQPRQEDAQPQQQQQQFNNNRRQQQPDNRNRKPIKALILTPTRELAIQIGESFSAYGRFLPLRHQVVFGGVPQFSQVNGIRRGVDILVATPGRLLDLMSQGHVSLRDIKYFVLDEADRMLDMGFVHDVKRIISKLPEKKQTLFFSATLPPEIQHLAGMLLNNPQKVSVTPTSSTAETVQQHLFFVEKKDKKALLIHLLETEGIETVLVFATTKHGADKVTRDLQKAGISADAIHGNKSQSARQSALKSFKARRTRVLVATDIAARGIDIDDLTHVINYDLPNVPETYVHRIGRTGRAGASGIALSFCCLEEKPWLTDIQKLIKRTIPVVNGHPYELILPTPQPRSNVHNPLRPGRGRSAGNVFKRRRTQRA